MNLAYNFIRGIPVIRCRFQDIMHPSWHLAFYISALTFSGFRGFTFYLPFLFS